MKKLLIVLCLTISLTTYSKPITLYVLRYNGSVLSVSLSDDYHLYRFEFNKNEIPSNVLVDGISEGLFNLRDSKVSVNEKVMDKFETIANYRYPVYKKLPSGFTITKETFDIK